MNIRLTGTLLLVLLMASVILFLPSHISMMVISLLAFFLLSVLFPKSMIIGLGVFLLVQKLLFFRFEDSVPLLALVFKRSEEAAVLILFLALFFRRAFLQRRPLKAGIEMPLFALVFLAVLGTIRSHLVRWDIALFDLFLLLKGFMVFYIVYFLDLTREDILRIAKIFLGVAGLVFFLGMVDLAAPVAFRTILQLGTDISYRFGFHSVQSIFVHPGIFGWFMAFFACFSYAFFSVFEKKYHLAYAVMFVVGAFLSLRFKPIVGLLAAGLTALFLVARGKRVRFVFIISALFLFFAIVFGEKAEQLWQDKLYTYLGAGEPYRVARNALYMTGWRIAMDFFPLGSGLASFGGWMAAIFYSPLYFHYGLDQVWGLEQGGQFLTDTFWPYLLGEFGFLGCLCYVWILILLLRTALRALNRAEDLFLKAFAFGAVLVLTEGFVESIAEPIFLTPPQYFFIFAGLGIVYTISARSAR